MKGFYRFIRALMIFLTKTLFPMRVYGLENIPKEGGYVLACNHTSMSDVIYLITTQKRVINFMGKAEIFQNRFVGFLFRKMHVFPVKRGAGDVGAINHAEELLKTGNVVGIFPEGTRRKDYGPPKSGKSGTVVIAANSGVGILPAAVYREGKFRVFRKTVMRYGEFIPAEKLAGALSERAEIKKNTTALMDSITELWSKKYGED